MIHFYTAKKFSRHDFGREDQAKLLCTGQYVPYDKRNYSAELPTTVSHNVTCLDCLVKLIPKKEQELAKMKMHWDYAMRAKEQL